MSLSNPIVPGMNARSSRLAVWSLVLGILSLVFLLACLGPLFAIPAVICGHKAYSQIAKSAGELSGQGLSLGGMITGYVSLGISLLFIPMMLAIAIPNFVKARETAQRNACRNNLRQIQAAKEAWTLTTQAQPGQVVLGTDLDPYLSGGFNTLVCPAGGTYIINVVGMAPTCSLTNHILGDSGGSQPY